MEQSGEEIACDAETEERARDRDQNAFGEQRAEDVGAVGAEGGSDGDLCLTRGAANGGETGEIEARQQQDGEHGGREGEQAGPRLARDDQIQ